MNVINKFNVNNKQVTLDADIIENMSANDVSYNSSLQYDENTVGDKLSKLESEIDVFKEDVTDEVNVFKEIVTDQVNNYAPIVINGNVTNAQDEEDLTSVDGLLKIKNRSALNGMGYVILRKNNSFIEQVTQENTIYEVRYKFDLRNAEVQVPNNSKIFLNGGSIIGGKLLFDNLEVYGAGTLTSNIEGNLYNKTITPQFFGAIADGKSHLLRESYSTLEEAQKVYDFVDSLEWEIDACAIQSCFNYIYNRTDCGGEVYFPAGKYMVNRELKCKAITPMLRGESVGSSEGGRQGVIIQWNDIDGGSEDEPKYIFTFERIKPDGTIEEGLKQGFRKVSDFEICNLCFRSNSVISTQTTDYVSALFISVSSHFNIHNCSFGNVYDSLVFSTVILSNISNCFFYGVYRDCIRIMRLKPRSGSGIYNVEFSTTFRIFRNEFGFFGRYAIYANTLGDSNTTPEIWGNDFEGTTTNSYYYQNPECFVQGIRANVVLLGGLCGYFNNNRFEANCYEYSLHLVNCSEMSFISNNFSYKGIALSATKTSYDTSIVTQDYIDYINSRYYDDISNTRNILLLEEQQFQHGNMMFLHNNFNSDESIFTEIGKSINTRSYSGWIVIGKQTYRNIPVVNGSLDIEHQEANFTFMGSNIVRISEGEIYFKELKFYNPVPANLKDILKVGTMLFDYHNGDVQSMQGFDGWTINSLISRPLFLHENNILDQPFLLANLTDGSKTVSYEFDVAKKRKIRYNYYDAPTSGTWSLGDIIYRIAPTLNTNIGWVCVSSGNPGTWKPFGLIYDSKNTKGTTAQRPIMEVSDEGFEYYDSTLKKKILWNGTAWTNIDGSSL